METKQEYGYCAECGFGKIVAMASLEGGNE